MNHDKDKAGRIPRIAILGIQREANGFAPAQMHAVDTMSKPRFESRKLGLIVERTGVGTSIARKKMP